MSESLGRFWMTMWRDDDGGVISAEYMILGSVVALGSVGGMAAMRDAANQEMAEYGHSLRAIRQAYSPAAPQSPAPMQIAPASSQSVAAEVPLGNAGVTVVP